jgi:LysM repeat protein
MAYEVYLGNMLCPIAPSKIQTKIKNQNKTMNLINNGEVSILKAAGLSEISFDLLLPNVKYPFATYKSGFVEAKVFLDEIEKMKVEKQPFQFKVIRKFPNGKMLFDTDMKVSLEDYTIKEDAKQGFDIVVTIKLKQYKDFGTKICEVTYTDDEATATPKTVRETKNSPAPTASVKKHTVVKGDCLWNIAKKYYGDGSKYKIIEDANGDKIKNPNLIYPGQVLTIPAV